MRKGCFTMLLFFVFLVIIITNLPEPRTNHESTTSTSSVSNQTKHHVVKKISFAEKFVAGFKAYKCLINTEDYLCGTFEKYIKTLNNTANSFSSILSTYTWLKNTQDDLAGYFPGCKIPNYLGPKLVDTMQTLDKTNTNIYPTLFSIISRTREYVGKNQLTIERVAELKSRVEEVALNCGIAKALKEELIKKWDKMEAERKKRIKQKLKKYGISEASVCRSFIAAIYNVPVKIVKAEPKKNYVLVYYYSKNMKKKVVDTCKVIDGHILYGRYNWKWFFPPTYPEYTYSIDAKNRILIVKEKYNDGSVATLKKKLL